jgi:hyperosmotically inducible protein
MQMRNILAAGLIASILILGSAIAAEPESRTAGQTTTDTTLATKVKTALIENDTTKAHQINVEVYKGQVQLNGFVDTAEEKAVAADIAGKIAGVTSVKNNLSVKAGERTAGESIDDGMITAKVKAALIGDSRTKAHQIDVTTREGIVQLGGFVDSASAKSAAAEVAESVDGVRSVQNGLNVRN